MTRIYCILIGLLVVSLASVANTRPHRTATDIAQKQTEMLVRELNITDSVLRDTLFRMHLKYAQLRNANTTRDEAMQSMIHMQEELQHILTPEQFATFIDRQLNGEPRTPQHPCNWIVPHSTR